MEYTRRLIKLGKHSKAIVIPMNFLKKQKEVDKVIIEEDGNKLIIKCESGREENGNSG